MRIAYADPPYPGQARKHYKRDPRCAEVDHAALGLRPEDEFVDLFPGSGAVTLAWELYRRQLPMWEGVS